VARSLSVLLSRLLSRNKAGLFQFPPGSLFAHFVRGEGFEMKGWGSFLYVSEIRDEGLVERL
jgi:hypothetical protein